MELLIWLGLTLCVLGSNGFSLTVTRGNQDSIKTNGAQQSADGLTCQNSNICRCEIGLTYIFDSESSRGKCVRDYEIIKDRSKGHFLPREKQCIGVTGKNAVSTTMVCNKNDLAVKWIWTAYDQMLNLKTLTCLIPKTRRKFSMRKCNVNVNSQKWACQIPYINVSNRGRPTFKQRWIKPEDGSYFQNCSQNLFSYKGCYSFDDGSRLKLITNSTCNRRNGKCNVQIIKIKAPIDQGYISCQLNWTNSAYSISGFRWVAFGKAMNKVQINKRNNLVVLKIKNTSFFLSKWKGHLLKLNIQCSNYASELESHCAILKVEGTATEQISIQVNQSSTSKPSYNPTEYVTYNATTEYTSTTLSNELTTTAFDTSTTPNTLDKSSLSSTEGLDSERKGQDSEDEPPSIVIPFVVAGVALFCLVIVGVLVIACRRLNRMSCDLSQNEEHIYEEAYPVDNVPASPIYMEIDDVKIRDKSTRKESSKKRKKSHIYDEPNNDPHYHTLEKPNKVNENEILNKNKILAQNETIDKNEVFDEPEESTESSQPKDFEKELDV